MFRLLPSVTTLGLWLLVTLSQSQAALNAYLLLEKVEPIPTDATHSWVDILGFTQGIENTLNIGSQTGGAGAGKATPKTATLQIASDQSIARMMTGLAKGESFTLTIDLVRPANGPGPIVTSQYIFRDTYFSDINSSSSAGDDHAIFNISFLYQSLEFTQTQLDLRNGQPTDTTSAGWDFVDNHEIFVPTSIPTLGDYDPNGSPPASHPDRDGDLIPNTWETSYGLDPDDPADASKDPDKDGFTNRQEYIAGTHPRQSNSFFRTTMTPLATNPGVEVEFTWSAIKDRTYVLQASSTPDGTFSPIHTITTTANGPQTYRPPANAGPYFRLSVRE